MITAGIDVGIENAKVVILKDGKVVAARQGPSGGFDRAELVEKLWHETLKEAKLASSDINNIVATGQGKWDARFAKDNVTEPIADMKAALWLFPSARSVIDVGADQARVVRFDANGKVVNHVLNQKCAAGLGIFLELASEIMGITLDEMSDESARAKNSVSVNDQCSVLAESDVLDLVCDHTVKADIARAISEAVAAKLSSVVNYITLENDVALVGGVARNAGVVTALAKRLGVSFKIPEQPEFACALGAALIAASES